MEPNRAARRHPPRAATPADGRVPCPPLGDDGKTRYFLYSTWVVLCLEDETGLTSKDFEPGVDGSAKRTTREQLAWLRWGLATSDPSLYIEPSGDDAADAERIATANRWLAERLHPHNSLPVNIAAVRAWEVAIPPDVQRTFNEAQISRRRDAAKMAEAAGAQKSVIEALLAGASPDQIAANMIARDTQDDPPPEDGGVVEADPLDATRTSPHGLSVVNTD